MAPILLAGMLWGCAEDRPALQVGFIGGLTGSPSENAEDGLRGASLAIEHVNQSGGLNGRLLELVVVDDAENAETAARATESLIRAQVAAVIGPYSGRMAQVVVPLTGKAGIFQISPSVSAMPFHGQDDHFFQFSRSPRDIAEDYARLLAGRRILRIAVAYAPDAPGLSRSWLQEFEAAYAARGGRILVALEHGAGAQADHAQTVRQLLAHQPEGLLFISGAPDVARFAQSARKLAPQLPLIAPEWAGTEQLLEFGGKVVEGLLVARHYDSADTSERFRAFSDAYSRRYKRNPGYSAVAAYDAATILLNALARQQKGERLEQVVLRSNPHVGLQQVIDFDASGDARRKVFFTEIRDGRYVRIADPDTPGPAPEASRAP